MIYDYLWRWNRSMYMLDIIMQVTVLSINLQWFRTRIAFVQWGKSEFGTWFVHWNYTIVKSIVSTALTCTISSLVIYSLLRLHSTQFPDKFIKFIWIQQNFKTWKSNLNFVCEKPWLVQLSLYDVNSNFFEFKTKQGNTDWRSTSKARFVFILDLCFNTAARSQNEVA